jgi:hypothetical protein
MPILQKARTNQRRRSITLDGRHCVHFGSPGRHDDAADDEISLSARDALARQKRIDIAVALFRRRVGRADEHG